MTTKEQWIQNCKDARNYGPGNCKGFVSEAVSCTKCWLTWLSIDRDHAPCPECGGWTRHKLTCSEIEF